MLKSYLIGVGSLVAMALVWALVQRAWLRVFPRQGRDPDALAGRGGCLGCGDHGADTCESDPSQPPRSRDGFVRVVHRGARLKVAGHGGNARRKS